MLTFPRYFLPILVCLALTWLAYPHTSQVSVPLPPTPDLEIFSREGCPRCAAAKRFVTHLQQQRPTLWIVVHEVDKEPAALARLHDLAAQQGIQTLGVPAFLVHGELLIGYVSAETTGARLQTLLDSPEWQADTTLPEDTCPSETFLACPEAPPGTATAAEDVAVPLLGHLNVRALGLPLFTVVMGLLDGFNPCAMWVLLFLLSVLVNLHNRTKMLLIGGTFVAVSGLAYFAFMTAWLNVFWFIGLSRATQLVLGSIALLVGAIHVKDGLAYGHGPSLSIPNAVKPGIYARVRRIVQAEHLLGALASVIVLAVLVNMVELLCTAGLPAMYTRILTLQRLPWWAYYGYLGLYNLAYMLDDSLMLLLAVVTLGRRKLQEEQGHWLKLVSGVVMLVLGGILIIQPQWLAG